jgi:hypothetical protein
MIVMRELLSVKQKQSISETPARGGGLVETCFSSPGRRVPIPGKHFGSTVAFRPMRSLTGGRIVGLPELSGPGDDVQDL